MSGELEESTSAVTLDTTVRDAGSGQEWLAAVVEAALDKPLRDFVDLESREYFEALGCDSTSFDGCMAVGDLKRLVKRAKEAPAVDATRSQGEGPSRCGNAPMARAACWQGQLHATPRASVVVARLCR